MKVKICVIACILVIGSIFFGCVNNKGITETHMNIVAKESTEGIVLYFDNIPKNTAHLNIALRDVARNDFQKAYFDSAISFEGNELAKLLETKTLVCPFVKNGHEYEIVIHSWAENEESNPILINAVAGGGISSVNNPSLSFNDENNALILSVKPAFTEGVTHSKEFPLFWYYCMGIENDEKKSDSRKFYGGFTIQTDELICDVSNIYNEIQAEFALDRNENFIITGFVGCFVDYDNLQWEIGIAKTDEIVVSL